MTTVRRAPDVARIAEAIKCKGIDPRVWAFTGVVLADATVEAGGIYADVRIDPIGVNLTCQVAQALTGVGAGVYIPLKQNDLVIVVVPHGEYSLGGVIIGRLVNAEDTNAQDVVDAPTDYHVILEEGRKLNVRTLGENTIAVTFDNGAVEVVCSNGAAVYLTENAVRIVHPTAVSIETPSTTASGALAVTGAVTAASVGAPAIAVSGVPVAVEGEAVTLTVSMAAWLAGLASLVSYTTPLPSQVGTITPIP